MKSKSLYIGMTFALAFSPAIYANYNDDVALNALTSEEREKQFMTEAEWEEEKAYVEQLEQQREEEVMEEEVELIEEEEAMEPIRSYDEGY